YFHVTGVQTCALPICIGPFRPGWCLSTRIAGGKEHRLKQGKIILVAHALPEDRTHHATPADQTYCLGHMAHFVLVIRKTPVILTPSIRRRPFRTWTPW